MIIRQIHNELDLLKFIATSETVIAAVDNANAKNSVLLTAEMEYSVAQMDQFWKVSRPESKALINQLMSQSVSKYLRSLQSIYDEEVEVFVTDASGLVIGMTNPTSDYLQSDEDWWKIARSEGVYIGNPAFDQSVGRWAIIIAVAINQPETSQFKGVLRGTVDVSAVIDAILQTRVGETGYGIYISGDGLVYSLADDKLIRNSVPIAFSNLLKSTGTRWGKNISDLNGVLSLMAVHPVTDGEHSLGWVAVLIQEAEINQLLKITLQQNIAVAVILMLILGGIAILFANNILAGFRLLEEEALKLVKGDYTHDFSNKVQATRERDVRNLVRTFDHMKQVIIDREKQLHESESRHRLLIETMNEGLALMDSDNKIQYMNPQLSDWTGYAPKTINNHGFLTIFPETEHEKIRVQIQLSKEGIQSPYESLIRTRDHGSMPVLISPQTMVDDRGNSIGSLVVVTDISENKKTEIALKKRIEELASLQQLDQSILDGTSIQNVVDAVFHQLRVQLQVHSGCLYLFDPSTREVKLASYFTGDTQGQCDPGQIRIDRLVSDYEQNKKGFLRLITNEQIINPELFVKEQNNMYSMPIHGVLNRIGVIQIGFEYLSDLDEEWQRYFETLMSQAALGFDKIELLDNLQLRNTELEEAYDSAIKGWANALELRDKETKGHSDRVVRLAEDIAKIKGYTGQDLTKIRIGSLMHDIGKMGVPDQILLKPGPLDDAEWVIMKKHPEFAYQLLNQIPFLKETTDIPRYHHEHWDGSGYPMHLKGEEIPLPARIFAIVDVWDALTSDRPYRKAWTREASLDYLRQNRGIQFDPEITDIFVSYIESYPYQT